MSSPVAPCTGWQDFLRQHSLLQKENGCGYLLETKRTLIQFRGADAASFVQNLCTNDVKGLKPGEGCEAFVTNVQGKIMGHGVFFRVGEQDIWFDGYGDQRSALLPHFDKYLITENVEVIDHSEAYKFALLCGGGAVRVAAAVVGENLSAGQFTQRDGIYAWPTGMCGDDDWVIAYSRERRVEITHGCQTAGAEPVEATAVEALRVERGSPLFGRDISVENLPQEVDRNERAISFTKGCYLGQETVARIDALGHVNKLLRQVAFDVADPKQTPAAATLYDVNGKEVGKAMSIVWSPKLGRPLALAYVRIANAEVGAPLRFEEGAAEVVRLANGGS